MQKTPFIIAATLVAALGSTAFVAQAHGRGGPDFDLTDMDANGDGQITQAEVTAFHAARFAEHDANNDGEISKDEMLAAMAARFDGDVPERATKRMDRMFDRMDADNSGGISADEQNSNDRMTRMFEHLDADEDGTISAEELEEAKDRRGKHGKGRKGGQGHGDKARDRS